MRLVMAIGAVALLGACQMTPSTGAPEPLNPPQVSPPNMQGTHPPGSGAPRSGPPRVAPPSSRMPAPADSCGAGRLQHLIGQPLPQTIPAQGPVRIYATGDPVTMDYLAERVNVEVDRSPQRRIVAISCG